MEALQRVLAGIGRVVDRRVVSDHHQLDALQPHHAVRLGPPAVVAQRHPHHTVERPPHTETVGRLLEVAPLEVLERTPRLVVLVAGDVHLAVVGHDRPVALDEHVCVVAVTVGRQLGVAEAEPDTEPGRLVEQRLGVRPRHLGLVERVELLTIVVEIPAREERRERQLGVDDELAPRLGGPVEQHQQPLDDLVARVASRPIGPSWAAPTVSTARHANS